MPQLEVGRVYRRTEVEDYIGYQDGTSDFDIVGLHFPKCVDTWQSGRGGWRNGQEMLVQYKVFSTAELRPQIQDLADVFAHLTEEQRRVELIIERLLNGESAFPVFMQQNDPQRRITEGKHRSVALMQLNSEFVPTFLTGYQDWFAK